MNRLPSLATRWLITCLVLTSLLIGRPLHEAHHLTDAPSAGLAFASADADEPAGEPATAHEGSACVWCLFHVPALLVGTVVASLPPLRALQAPPLPGPATGLVVAEIRAAAPRGPP